jgi:hypothetical protein
MTVWKGYSVPGFGNTNSYLASGIPWVSGGTIASGSVGASEVRLQFPYITRTITIINKGTPDIFIHFNSAVEEPRVISGHHYISLIDNKDSITVDMRVKEIYLSYGGGSGPAAYEVICELTPIPSADMPQGFITGSGLTD